MRDRALDEVDALVGAECPLLVGVVQHRDDDVVEQRRAPLDDVEVSQRQRVERAGADARRHDVTFAMSSGVPVTTISGTT